MDRQRIIKAAKVLNETKLSKIKVKTVGLKQEDLQELFMVACEAVPEEEEGKLPQEVMDTYNDLRFETDSELGAPEEELKEEKKEPEMPKEEAPKVSSPEKEETFETIQEKIKQNKDSSVASFITFLLLESPKTLEEIYTKVKETPSGKEAKSYGTSNSIKQHISFLIKKGYEITSVNDTFQIVGFNTKKG